MEDFRNKLKNYKATPNDNSWERMLIKKEKARIHKMKNFFYVLIALNALGLAIIAYQYWNAPLKVETSPVITTASIENINSNDNAKDLTQDYLDKINLLTSKNSELQNQIELLQHNLSEAKQSFKSKEAKLLQRVNERNSSITLANQLGSIIKPKSKVSPSENTILDEKSQNKFLPHSPVLVDRKNSVQKYLLELSDDINSVPLLSNQTTIEEDIVRRWYVTLGTSRENLVSDKQSNLNVGLNRSVNKFFDVGFNLEYSIQKERAEFRINENVKDHTTETIGLLQVRFKALRLNKLLLHADAGIGYRFGNIINRRGQIIENELQYYNEAISYHGIAYQLALGAMYDLSPRFSVGTRFYLDTNLHSTLNVNYKF